MNQRSRPEEVAGFMDVARAVFYTIEQEYETGQAIPVTGGTEYVKLI